MGKGCGIGCSLPFFLLGAFWILTSLFALPHVREAPIRVTIHEVEDGLRSTQWWRAASSDWWRVIDGVFLYDKAVFDSSGHVVIPYASDPDASWDDVHLIVEFNLIDIDLDSIKSYGSPVGTIASSAELGSLYLPEELLEAVPGIGARATLLHADHEPSHPASTARLGAFVLMVAIFIALLVTEDARDWILHWPEGSSIHPGSSELLEESGDDDGLADDVAKRDPRYRYTFASYPHGPKPAQDLPEVRPEEAEPRSTQHHLDPEDVVRRWRGEAASIGRPPRWLKPLLANPANEEALRHLLAHLEEAERDVALHYCLPLNPSLALKWADDLSVEHGIDAVEPFLSELQRFAVAGRRRLAGWHYLKVLAAGIFFSYLVSALVGGIWGLDELFFPSATFALIGSSVAAALLIRFLLSPSRQKLDALLASPVNVHTDELRQRLTSVIAMMKPLTGSEMKVFIEQFSEDSLDLETAPMDVLRHGGLEHRAVHILTHMDHPLALPSLKHLAIYRTRVSADALRAMALRCAKFSNEKEKIIEHARKIWADEHLDSRIRLAAHALLKGAALESPRKRRVLGRHLLIRATLLGGMIALLSYWWYPGFVDIFMTTEASPQTAEPSPDQDDPSGTGCILILAFTIALLTDVSRRNVRAIPLWGSVNLPKWIYLLLNIWFYNILVPLYLLNRSWTVNAWSQLKWGSIEKDVLGEEDALKTLEEQAEDVTRILRDQDAWDISFQILDHEKGPLTLPFLVHLLDYGHAFSLEALNVMRRRCKYLPHERNVIANICGRVLRNSRMHYRMRLCADRALRASGRPGVDWRIAVKGLGLLCLLSLPGLTWVASPFLSDNLLPSWFFSSTLLLSLIVLFVVPKDLRRIRPSSGQTFSESKRFHNWPPGLYVFSCFFLPYFFIPLYLFDRDLIRKDGPRIDRGFVKKWLEAQWAVGFLEKDLKNARKAADRREEGAVLESLALAYADMKETRKASDCYEQHMEIVRESDAKMTP